jgi:hypothetical protein
MDAAPTEQPAQTSDHQFGKSWPFIRAAEIKCKGYFERCRCYSCFIAESIAANSCFIVASVSSPMFEMRKVVPLIFP